MADGRHIVSEDFGAPLPPALTSEAHPEDLLSARACRALWAQVLLLLWDDSFSDGPSLGSSTRLSLRRKEACSWFGSADFGTVCNLAGLDARAVLDRWRSLQARFEAGEDVRRERGTNRRG